MSRSGEVAAIVAGVDLFRLRRLYAAVVEASMSDLPAAGPVKLKQCRSCPWRVDCEPLTDIPNGYSVELHEALRGTIARPGAINVFEGCQRVMACHYSEVGKEIPCAGWIANQICNGNNIALRIQVMRGEMPVPEIDGEQHATFEETLPDV